MEFKQGDIVRCVDNKGFGIDLTLNKEYTVIRAYNTSVFIIDDKGGEYAYNNPRFELVVGWIPKKGELVLVKDDSSEEWLERVFIVDLGEKYKNRYLCEKVTESHIFIGWEQIKKLEPQVTELTMDEIANKFNIPVEQLKIKK